MTARRADVPGKSFPSASLAIASACCLVLLVAGPRMVHEARALHDALTQAAELFLADSSLAVPPACAAPGRIERVRAETRRVGLDPALLEPLSPSAAGHAQTLESESRRARDTQRLLELCNTVAHLEHDSFAARFGFVPARGIVQRGWLTHLFVHAGWLHLAMNLFFLLLVGPALEARVGSLRPAGVLLVGGLAAAGAHAIAFAGSDGPLVGLSGGIAALVALSALRLGRARVAPLAWTRLPSASGSIPGWLPVALWLANEGYHLVVHGTAGGVSYVAHAGGIIVGIVASRWVQA